MHNFLQRPQLKVDEWWNAYAARVLAENGSAATNGYMLNKLEFLVAQLVSKDDRKRALAGNAIGDSLRIFSHWELPLWAVRGESASIAYCPTCFGDEPYVRLSWRLRCVSHCALHGAELQTRCGACSRALFHWDLARQVCRCGTSIAQLNSHQSLDDVEEDGPTDIHGRNWIFSSQVIDRVLGEANATREGGPSETLAVVIFLGRLLPELAKCPMVGVSKEARTIKGFLQSLGLTLAPTKNFVQVLFESLRSAPHLSRALTVVLSVSEAERHQGTALSGLPLREWAELLNRLGASPRRAIRLGLAVEGGLCRELVPMKVAAREAGLTEMHLYYLMARGVVAPTRTLDVGARQHLFSSQQVEELARLRPQGYGYGNALNLGLEPPAIKVLRTAGIVEVIPCNDGRTWLDSEALRSLLQELGARAVPVDTVRDLLIKSSP